MTRRTFLGGVFTGLILQALGHCAMTNPALLFQSGRIRDGNQRLMGILMAGQTIHYRLVCSMRCIMATGAFGHDLRVIIFQWIIGVKNFVTVCTDNLGMFCSLRLDPVKLRCMAAGAIRNGKRFDLDIVYAPLGSGSHPGIPPYQERKK